MSRERSIRQEDKKSQEENIHSFSPDFVINGRDASLVDYRLSFRL